MLVTFTRSNCMPCFGRGILQPQSSQPPAISTYLPKLDVNCMFRAQCTAKTLIQESSGGNYMIISYNSTDCDSVSQKVQIYRNLRKQDDLQITEVSLLVLLWAHVNAIKPLAVLFCFLAPAIVSPSHSSETYRSYHKHLKKTPMALIKKHLLRSMVLRPIPRRGQYPSWIHFSKGSSFSFRFQLLPIQGKWISKG